MKARALLFTAILSFTPSLTGCLRRELTQLNGKTPDCLQLVNASSTLDDGPPYIVGTIRNNCEYRFGQVTIVFKVTRVPGPNEEVTGGFTAAYAHDVEPGTTKEFKTAVPVMGGSIFQF